MRPPPNPTRVPFPNDLNLPLQTTADNAFLLPRWVYRALEADLLQQMQARLAPERYDFAVPTPFSILGWKLGDTTFPAPKGYGHPECTLEYFWVATHLTPDVACRHTGPVGANQVQCLYATQAPESWPHQGALLTTHLPTAGLPPVTRWTTAGEIYRTLTPQTYPEQISGSGIVLLAGEEPALCLQAGHDTPEELLRVFQGRVRRARDWRVPG